MRPRLSSAWTESAECSSPDLPTSAGPWFSERRPLGTSTVLGNRCAAARGNYSW